MTDALGPDCPWCLGTGEVVSYFRGGEEPEFTPCECAAGLLLAAQISEAMTGRERVASHTTSAAPWTTSRPLSTETR